VSQPRIASAIQMSARSRTSYKPTVDQRWSISRIVANPSVSAASLLQRRGRAAGVELVLRLVPTIEESGSSFSVHGRDVRHLSRGSFLAFVSAAKDEPRGYEVSEGRHEPERNVEQADKYGPEAPLLGG
jgi:hypothetical protein